MNSTNVSGGLGQTNSGEYSTSRKQAYFYDQSNKNPNQRPYFTWF